MLGTSTQKAGDDLNPTGSFKNRGSGVLMSLAVEAGVTEVVEDSSGNAGASIAAYAARAGIGAHIFAPSSAPSAKLDQIAVYGATTHLIEGNRQDVTDAAMEFAGHNSIVYASHNLSPYFTEGTKTFAYEIVEQFNGGLPEHIVIPVGNGSLLIGAHRGFSEMKPRGAISAIPKLHAIQARACDAPGGGLRGTRIGLPRRRAILSRAESQSSTRRDCARPLHAA